MGYRSMRRRMRQAMAGRDWLEGTLTALGVVFFVIAALCAYATVVLILHFRDGEAGFPAGQGFVKGIKGVGLGLFPVFGLVTFLVGWALAGDRLLGRLRRVMRRRRDG